ncbi:MAG: flagellar hook-length control protein FliK [Clostridiales bacterium]|nr:flagellar hook-length control protein FliK [Clostridiales bacterium]
MGTAKISDLGKVVTQNASSQAVGAGEKIKEEQEKISFLDMMNQMTLSGMELFSKENQAAADSVGLVQGTAKTDLSYDKFKHREYDAVNRHSAKDIQDDGTQAEKVEQFVQDVKTTLTEELGITEDQLEAAMEVLGITVMDLLNPNMLAALVMELTGCADVSQLLCNSEFMTVMQAIGGLTEELLSELGISAQELEQMLVAAKESEVGIAKDSQTEPEMPVENVMPTEEAEQVQEAELLSDEQPKMAEKETESLKLQEEEPAAESEVTMSKTAESDAFEGKHSFEQSSSQSGSQDTAGHQAMLGQAQPEMITVQNADGTTTFIQQIDVENIIRQIVEFSRVTIGTAATTLELQLNPENLGKLYLEVTSKAGVVTAHITAQNQVVKEALEAQIVELRENMTQAGVKVDAVEVTVESHAFERNLEQDARRDEAQAEEREKAAKATRRLNRNELDELSGLMTEEESLVAQMMAEQGNSVDYTV